MDNDDQKIATNPKLFADEEELEERIVEGEELNQQFKMVRENWLQPLNYPSGRKTRSLKVKVPLVDQDNLEHNILLISKN
jgi:hypothetical protein